MFIENFDKIYLHTLSTPYWSYTISKDDMKITHNHYAIRLTPTVSNGKERHFSVLIGKYPDHIKCAIYNDRDWQPLEVFQLSRMDLKRIETFGKLLSQKIQNYEY